MPKIKDVLEAIKCAKDGGLIDLCFSGKFDENTMAYLDTLDAREIEKMINNGDEYAELIYEAMAYQIAKAMDSLAYDILRVLTREEVAREYTE